MGPGPSSVTGRRSPSDSALRSAPAQKLPPAPVSTATEALSSSSKALKAANSAAAVAESTALRRSGRKIVTTMTGPSREMSTVFQTASPTGSPLTGGLDHGQGLEGATGSGAHA